MAPSNFYIDREVLGESPKDDHNLKMQFRGEFPVVLAFSPGPGYLFEVPPW